MTVNAIKCSLKTKAKEILVSEDASGINLNEYLRDELEDSRLKIFIQETNLGLWPNHLFLLNQSTSNWIKFLQTDDFFDVNSFNMFCLKASEDVALITTEPIYFYGDDKQVNLKRLEKEKILTAGEINNWILKFGNFIGRPSYCLYNKSLMILDKSIWKNEISVDLFQNWYLGNQGKVIILPASGVYCGVHPDQEGNNQSISLVVTRLVGTLSLIESYSKSERDNSFFISVYKSVEYTYLFIILIKLTFFNNEISLAQFKIFKKQLFSFSLNKFFSPKFIYSFIIFFSFKIRKNIKWA
jgi:hypothetical protein